MFEVLIIAVIFGYAAWTLYRLFINSKKGACSACSQNKSCSMSSCHTSSSLPSKQVDAHGSSLQEHQ
ncbi:FeoB-associated Cys-rich membrane protein [Neobacillus drentensis]|uniref:FeoB-associated Cys-rich membrane protein n=1 Tax=Neobacillus drentensis TaxID=220684 RepID=UPI0030011DB0